MAVATAMREPVLGRSEQARLLRIAAIDARLDRLDGSAREIAGLLERRRADLGALGELIEADRAWLEAARPASRQEQEKHHRQRLRNEEARAELARAIERDEAEASEMSSSLRRQAEELRGRRRAFADAVPRAALARYEETLSAGVKPPVCPLRRGLCSACGTPLDTQTCAVVLERRGLAFCSRCGRLLHDPGEPGS